MSIPAMDGKTEQEQKLRFRPSQLKHRYGMVIRHFEGEMETLKMHYALTVSSAGDTAGTQAEVLVDKEQVYINNQAPQLLAEQLADQVGKCLYPVRLSVDAQGSMVSVTNEMEIRKRWDKAKPALEQYYIGSVADAVFSSMEAQLASGRYLTGNLKKDLFFALYFQGLYENNPVRYERNTAFPFPLMPFGTPVLFSGRYSREQDENSDKIVINFKGTCADERSYRDIVLKKILPSGAAADKAKGRLELVYKLYPGTHVIYAITGFVQVSDGADSRSIVIELFHQPGSEAVADKREAQTNIITEQQVVTRKPFWALFKK